MGSLRESVIGSGVIRDIIFTKVAKGLFLN